MMGDYVLQMKEVSKSFGGVHALKEVDLNLRKGEVLCLVGENGAGKSTLMKILSGVLTPDKGEIILKGEKMPIRNPAEAYRAGISIVHQELIQIPSMSVAENIYLGRYDTKGGFISFRKLVERTEELMEKLDIYFDPESRLSTYSVAQRQLIEILKALSYDASIIIFDEPTAALTTDESELLYKIIRAGTRDGCRTWAVDMLTAYPEAKGFFTFYGDGAIGTYFGVKDNGREDITIVGYDASAEQQEIMIADGSGCILQASVAQYPKMMGRMAVETMKELFEGTYTKEGAEDIIYIEPGVLKAEEAENYEEKE